LHCFHGRQRRREPLLHGFDPASRRERLISRAICLERFRSLDRRGFPDSVARDLTTKTW
jgi:hypothetical protein